MALPQHSRDWESKFRAWAKPPSQTEQDRCDHALDAVKKAIAKSPALAQRKPRIFTQGSYANRTNVRQDSDVDVCVLCDQTFFFELPNGVALPVNDGGPVVYPYTQYKNEAEAALVAHFGAANGSQGDKAFDIHENTYRVDADVVVCFEYRLYYRNRIGQLCYLPGTALLTDREQHRITNFPELQYSNGVAKNNATGRRFKALVRIIKTLRNEMEEEGYTVARPIASFLIESLVWNWPTELFNGQSSWKGMVTAFIAWLWGGTKSDAQCADWTEENGIKTLFGPHNEWTRDQVRAFALAAFTYIENQ